MPAEYAGLPVGGSRADARLYELTELLAHSGKPCALVRPEGRRLSYGESQPRFELVLRSESVLDRPLTQLSLAEAYVHGEIDVTGDVLAALDLRDSLPLGIPAAQLVRLARDFLLPATLANQQAIDHHYSLGDDFYLTFLDRRHHFYSHCLFETGGETLEEAADRKLDAMWRALGLQPGMRVLDIGGGWGGLAAHCAERGVHVTSLTLTEDSADYIRYRTRDAAVPPDVIVEDILDHYPSRPYDHAVIFGVIEHIPNYRRFCERVWGALQPGGKLYLDASATREKYAVSAFTREYTWRGPHSCLALQDMTTELLLNGFDIDWTQGQTRHYERTMRHWAARFDAAHDAVAARWGEDVYRAFRIFLWGGVHGFMTDRLQAYCVVAIRREDAGPRPGALRRLGHFLGAMASR